MWENPGRLSCKFISSFPCFAFACAAAYGKYTQNASCYYESLDGEDRGTRNKWFSHLDDQIGGSKAREKELKGAGDMFNSSSRNQNRCGRPA